MFLVLSCSTSAVSPSRTTALVPHATSEIFNPLPAKLYWPLRPAVHQMHCGLLREHLSTMPVLCPRCLPRWIWTRLTCCRAAQPEPLALKTRALACHCAWQPFPTTAGNSYPRAQVLQRDASDGDLPVGCTLVHVLAHVAASSIAHRRTSLGPDTTRRVGTDCDYGPASFCFTCDRLLFFS